MGEDLNLRRLAQAFAACGLSQAELARKTGIDRGSISLYLSGRYRPKADKLMRLAAALNVSPEWLSGLDTPAVPAALSLPVFDGLDGAGRLVPTGQSCPIPRDFLGGAPEEACFVLRHTGLAMYPRLLEGDLLLVQGVDKLPEGAVAILAQDGALLVRLFSGGRLLPANPEYPPRALQPDARIFGRAIRLIRTL